MTSINTNIAATTALRTLQATNSQLETTQSRISTGLKIGEAKDNAAYWSISTTLKSDNKSLSTVKEALGLGAATVDVAYQGLNAAKDVLDEIKSKLTTATQDGVNKDTIQAEIAELQKQLKSIAGSSVFSGENWLSVNTSSSDYTDTKNVVASFARDGSGAISIGTIGVDISKTALFDAGTNKTGILDAVGGLKADGVDLNFGGIAASGNSSTGGLTDAVAVAGTGAGAAASFVYDASFATGDYNVGDRISFNVSLDNGASYQAVSLVATTANTANAGAFADAMTEAFDAALGEGKLIAEDTGASIAFRTTDQGTDAQFRIQDISVTDGDGVITSRLGLTASALSDTTAADGQTASVVFGEFNRAGLSVGDRLTFSLDTDASGVPTTYNLNLTEANTANATDFAAALDALVTGDGYTISASGNTITAALAAATTGFGTGAEANSQIDVSAVSVRDGNTATSSLGSAVIAGTADADVVGTGTKASATLGTFEAMTFDADDKVTFNLAVDGAPASLITIDRATVDAALGTTDGKISSATQFATVLNSIFADDNLAVSAQLNADRGLEIVTTQAGAARSLDISSVVADKGTLAGAQGLSVVDINISSAVLTARGATTDGQKTQAINAYIALVNSAMNNLTTAASNLGAASSRIELQQTFVSNLMDTIDAGVSGLVDADMNEESTRLQALQVKQQLGVQALSIANQSAQNVLSLFR